MSIPTIGSRQRQRDALKASGIRCGVPDCDAHVPQPQAGPGRRIPLPCRLGFHGHWRLVRADEGRPPMPGAPPPGLPDYADGGAAAVCLACGRKLHVGYEAAVRAKG